MSLSQSNHLCTLLKRDFGGSHAFLRETYLYGHIGSGQNIWTNFSFNTLLLLCVVVDEQWLHIIVSFHFISFSFIFTG